MRKLILPALLAALTFSAQADPNISWGVTISSGMPPPPAVRYEPVPAPRASQVWVQGFWNWSGGNYVWVPGHWVAARPGYVYGQPQWVQGPNGWVLKGGWKSGPGGGPGHCPPGQRKKGNC